MQNTSQQLPPLAEYVDRAEAQDRLKASYPSKPSFDWMVRRYRDRLAASGALILVAGRQKFHIALTEQVIVEAGQLDALGEGGE